MTRSRPLPLAVASALLLLLLASLAGPATAAQSDRRCFPETGHCIEGPIRAYWERNGGLPVFGYPISTVLFIDVEGQTLTAQWFERDRLEDHGADGVMAGRLGAQLLEWRGAPWEGLPQASGPAPGCRFFPETRHNLCEPYLGYWERNGGLAGFGYPISEPMAESVGNWYGSVQYFERRRMEFHPDRPGAPILLGLLGRTLSDLQSLSVCPFPVHGPWRAGYSRVSFLAALGCPSPAVQSAASAVQHFEGGQMLWLDLGTAGRKIYVLPTQTPVVETGLAPWRYQVFDDTWSEGQPVDSGLMPPDGLREPRRGFGKLWREHPELRLGWATAPEQAGAAEVLPFGSGGLLLAIPHATDDPRRGFSSLFAFAPDGRVERVRQ